MDLIQIALLVAACYACYVKGFNTGARSILEQLEAAGVVKMQHEEEQEEK